MEDEASLLVEAWEAMKEFLPSNVLNDAAVALVSAFINQGIEVDELDGAAEGCPYLERALDSLKDEADPEESDDEEY